jgi:predicted nucleotidyltransferase
MLDKSEVIDTVKRYADVVTKEFSPMSIILFGSYAKGNPREDSDIDVAVIFNGFSGDWLKASARLWRFTHDISFDLEPHLLDITQDGSGFVKHVIKTGEVIYQAQ